MSSSVPIYVDVLFQSTTSWSGRDTTSEKVVHPSLISTLYIKHTKRKYWIKKQPLRGRRGGGLRRTRKGFYINNKWHKHTHTLNYDTETIKRYSYVVSESKNLSTSYNTSNIPTRYQISQERATTVLIGITKETRKYSLYRYRYPI